MKITEKIRKGSFTVEAAVIIPMIAIVVSLLLGYAFYTHQKVWCTGALYESLLYASARDEESGLSAEERVSKHLNVRIGEIPLSVGNITSETNEGALTFTAKYGICVLENVFGDFFGTSAEGSVLKEDPVDIKLLEWFGRSFIED